MTELVLPALAIFVALLAAGAHAGVPFRLAEAGAEEARRLWARAALPLLLALALLALVRARLDPAPFLGAGLVPIGPSPVTTAALVGLGTLTLVDLFLLAFHARLEPKGWLLVGVVGALGLGAWSALEEAARVGSGPAIPLEHYLGGLLSWAALALAAGVLVFSRPGSGFGRTLGLVSLAAAGGLWAVTAPWVRESLAAGGDPLTLAAGAVLLGAAPFVPEKLRRVSALFGALLLALFLARAGAVSEQLGQAGRVPPPLP